MSLKKLQLIGSVNLFTFFEPLAGHRVAYARDRRTMIDWPECVRRAPGEHYREASTVVLVMDILVMDNLNTHGVANLYEAFEPAEARRLAKHLEIHYTPEHAVG